MAIRALERVPVDQIETEAAQIQPGRGLRTLLIGVFYAVGWTAGKVSVGGRLAMAGIRRGWKDARAGLDGPRGGR
jgi:hypothetical protein